MGHRPQTSLEPATTKSPGSGLEAGRPADSTETAPAPRRGSTTAIGVAALLFGLLSVAVAVYNADGVLVNGRADGSTYIPGVSRSALIPNSILGFISAGALLAMGVSILGRKPVAIRFTQYALIATTLRCALTCILVTSALADRKSNPGVSFVSGCFGVVVYWAIAVLIYAAILRYLRSPASRAEFRGE